MSTFALNCHNPPDVVSFVSSTDGRGTYDMELHQRFDHLYMDFSAYELAASSSAPHRKTEMATEATLIFLKAEMTVLTVIAAERLLGKALIDLLSAWHSCDMI